MGDKRERYAMVEKLLKEINKIDGVDGVFIVTNRAEIVSKTGLEYSDKQLSALSTHFLRIIAGLHIKGKKTTELELYWQNKYIICKNSDQFLAVVFCNTPHILAVIRITLNVTVAKLLENKKFIKWLKSHIAGKEFMLRKGTLDITEERLLEYIT